MKSKLRRSIARWLNMKGNTPDRSPSCHQKLMETKMAHNAVHSEESLTMSRPRILVQTAKIGARHYRRSRDLPGAVPGLISQPVSSIVPRLMEVEAQCEEDRRAKVSSYRPGKHVQVLAALLAEAAPMPCAG